MKVFHVVVDNGPEWKYDNSLQQTFYVLADDTTDALMVALETLEILREKLSAKGFIEQSKSLDIDSITLLGSAVGRAVSKESLDDWCTEVSNKIKKNADL